MNSLSPCGELVRRGDPARFRDALFAAPAHRERLFALYAFNLELARIAPMVSEPMLGEIRLQWWRETLDMAFGGADARRHEVAAPLTQAIRDSGIERAPLDAMIDARAVELVPEFPQDETALDAYLAGTGGALARAASAMLAPGGTTNQVAGDAGFAIAAARYLAAVPALAAQGQAPLPGSIDWPALQRGESDPALAMAVQRLASDGLGRLARARESRAQLPLAVSPALIEAGRAAISLRRLSRKANDFTALVAATPSPFRGRLDRLLRGSLRRW